MTQVNPIWAQVHTVAADGTTSFLDDVKITGALGLNGTTPTNGLLEATWAPSDLTGKTNAVTFTPTFLDVLAGIGLQVNTFYNRTSNGGGNSASLFGQASTGTGSFNWNGNTAGVQGYSIFTSTTGSSTGTFAGGEFHGANEHNATGNTTNITGVNAMARHYGTGTTTNAIAIRATTDLGRSDNATTDGNVTTGIGVYSIVKNISTAATPGVITNGYGFYADTPDDTAAIGLTAGIRIVNQGGTHANITTSHGILINAQSGATSSSSALTTLGGAISLNVGLTKASATSVVWDGFTFPTSTFTATGGTAITRTDGVNLVNIFAPAIATAANVTNAAVLAIKGPTTISGGGTLTNNPMIWLGSAVTTVAGGATGAALSIGTSGTAPLLGIYWGSGAPTISAPQGSLYLRTDGISGTRAYINTNGTTGWTGITTAA